jgi:hypothetical protein
MDIVELITDEHSKSDILGFGLSVLRPEVAIDEPTKMRIDSISNTIVSQSALLDAIKYKIDVQHKVRKVIDTFTRLY